MQNLVNHKHRHFDIVLVLNWGQTSNFKLIKTDRGLGAFSGMQYKVKYEAIKLSSNISNVLTVPECAELTLVIYQPFFHLTTLYPFILV